MNDERGLTRLTNGEMRAFNEAYGRVYGQTGGNHTVAAAAGDDAVVEHRRKQRMAAERNAERDSAREAK